MRVGIFGGSFDPVHYGHLLLAELCRESCQLDEVCFVPAAVPPHKQGNDRAANEDRLEMLKLAIGGHPSMSAGDVEIRRGGVSYTVETLRAFHNERPSDGIFFLMGADSLYDLPNWREPVEICKLANIVVVDRPGNKTVDFGVLSEIVAADRIAEFRQNVVAMPQIDISSTEIRRRVQAGQTIRYQTPRAVEQYIETAKLYRDE